MGRLGSVGQLTDILTAAATVLPLGWPARTRRSAPVAYLLPNGRAGTLLRYIHIA
jgi:hypothetical protein